MRNRNSTPQRSVQEDNSVPEDAEPGLRNHYDQSSSTQSEPLRRNNTNATDPPDNSSESKPIDADHAQAFSSFSRSKVSSTKTAIKSKMSSVYESATDLFHKRMYSSHVDSTFEDPNIEYEILSKVISETLDSKSKWMQASEKVIIKNNPQSLPSSQFRQQQRIGESSISKTQPQVIELNDLPQPNKQNPSLSQQESSYNSNDPFSTPPISQENSFSAAPYRYQKISPTVPLENKKRPFTKMHSTVYNALGAGETSIFSKIFAHIRRIADNVSGTQPHRTELIGKSLLLFSAENPFRKFCLKLSTCAVSSLIISTLIFLELFLLSYQMWDPSKTGYIHIKHYSWIDYTLIFTNSLYGFFILVKILAFGLFSNADFHEIRSTTGFSRQAIKAFFLSTPKSHSNVYSTSRTLSTDSTDQVLCYAYLRSISHVVDLIGFVSFIISTCLGLSGYELESKFLLFRSLMCLKLLRICNLTRGSRTIQRSFHRAFPVLVKISAILIFILLWFSIVSIQAFSETFRKQCVLVDKENDIFRLSGQLCGGYLEKDDNGHQVIQSSVIGSSYSKSHKFDSEYYESLLDDNFRSTKLGATGFICPEKSLCIFGENPNKGTLSFDNLWSAIQIMFVLLSSNTFSNSFYSVMDSNAVYQACFFYIPALIVLAVWMINILIASILDSLSITKEEDGEEGDGEEGDGEEEDGKDRSMFGDSILGFYASLTTYDKIWGPSKQKLWS
ncbi:unnamed protein product [Ambrosiozyma monospora]|uniref:Unnamed protein product n=1 Tax=Ambrosiozyma monospora TaxID=43982 RepID=A0A9W6YSZ5_AMBMO|nr:unnamed protein product [Ambrosiozyma monospora]